MEEELNKQRDENISWRARHIERTNQWLQVAESNYGGDASAINEDGELAQAYEALRETNRQLSEELLHMEREKKRAETDHKEQVDQLKRKLNNLQKQIDQVPCSLYLNVQRLLECSLFLIYYFIIYVIHLKWFRKLNRFWIPLL